ncbi:hypothetical protein IOQ59_13590 [Pontibacterium sp. N1Y112]|uniref:Uncharacterized protein n=1 Tax=Pontibacterium sinense TaxID=2781979 RepID=A0A8J7FEQ2_9GAMM|nr:hypothetical protein [Pontibacterium sinense]MBE9398289.1 hypothetical protein [Pontibacterium sinense]
MEIYLSLFAVFISVASLVVSGYRIYRDRSKLCAFATVVLDGSKDPENPPPQLRIYAVNRGPRPVILTDFGSQISRKESSSTPINSEKIDRDDGGDFIKLPEQLAHNIGVKLEDGDIYEVRIKHDDMTELYDAFHSGKRVKKFFFKDVLGKKYFVKSSRKGIDTLCDYKS